MGSTLEDKNALMGKFVSFNFRALKGYCTVFSLFPEIFLINRSS